MSNADDGVLGGEPFFRVVRDRHPDVDLVILPPIDAPDPNQIETPLDDVRTIAAHTRDSLATVLVAAGHSSSTVSGESWPYLNSPIARRLKIRASIRDLGDDVVPVLRRIGDELLAMGWDARPVVDESPRLMASDGKHLLEANAVGPNVDLWIDSPAFVATEETVTQLERDAQ